MYRQGCQFYGGDGIVTKGVENTIAAIGKLAQEGIELTDFEEEADIIIINSCKTAL